eukprot:1222533-Pyramimonas_sp.AAC.1
MGANGQLGYESSSDVGRTTASMPAPPVQVGEEVVGVAAGVYHTCAVLASGKIRCWGDNRCATYRMHASINLVRTRKSIGSILSGTECAFVRCAAMASSG